MADIVQLYTVSLAITDCGWSLVERPVMLLKNQFVYLRNKSLLSELVIEVAKKASSSYIQIFSTNQNMILLQSNPFYSNKRYQSFPTSYQWFQSKEFSLCVIYNTKSDYFYD